MGSLDSLGWGCSSQRKRCSGILLFFLDMCPVVIYEDITMRRGYSFMGLMMRMKMVDERSMEKTRRNNEMCGIFPLA